MRSRMAAHLLNVDKELAQTVANALRLEPMPPRAEAARPTRTDLKASPALSILLNGPNSFEGRKGEILVSDGIDAGLIAALRKTLEKEGATLEIVALRIGGVKASDGSLIAAQETISGGPSLLFDAVALLVSDEGATQLMNEPPAREFIAEALAHSKFIAYTEPVVPMLKAVIGDNLDAGFVEINTASDFAGFAKSCRKLRFWERKPMFEKRDDPKTRR